MLLTTPSGLELLERMRSNYGSPEYFEVVVRAEMDGDTVLKVSPVALRPLAASP
jgi:hypothetical protein